MGEIHPIGSVIETPEGEKNVVCGYRLANAGGNAALFYLMVPYPLGYLDERSLRLVAVDHEHAVIHTGLVYGATDRYLVKLRELNERAVQSDYERVLVLTKSFSAFLSEGANGDE